MTTHIEKRKQTFKVRDENITVEADALLDNKTNKILFDLDLDNQAIDLAFNIYRQKNNLISPAEMVAFRKKYQLSQRSLAKLLDVGSATIARYEKGILPSESINNLLRKIKDDSSFFVSLFHQNKFKLSAKDQKRIEAAISKIDKQIKSDSLLNAYLFRNQNDQHTIEDGFSKFDLDKFTNMVLYFAQNNPKLSKTRLNKLLFYSDFRFFKENSVSISGTTYIHDYYGPVPSDFELLYTLLKDNDEIETKPFNDGHGEMFISAQEFNKNLFTNEELKVLKTVSDDFKDYNAKKITDYSHQEKAYQDTKMKAVIPYNYALDLQ